MRSMVRAAGSALFMAFAIAAISGLSGCSSGAGGDPCLDETLCPGSDPNSATDDPNPNVPLCADTGVSHVGLGGVELNAARVKGVLGADRGRSKPYSALKTEYARVLGSQNTPTLLASSGSTFGEADARWFQEPQASAVSLFTAYRVAFDGCLQLTGAVDNVAGSAQGDAKYAAAPDANSAKIECEAWARKFWSRAATPPEVQACVDVAVTNSLQETFNGKTTDTPPKRRWAYACASVLSSTGFLAY